MSLVLGLAAPIALIASCAGFGCTILRFSGANRAARNCAETFGLGFVLGMGFIGWVLFFFGIAGGFSTSIFWLVTGIGILLLAFGFPIYRFPRLQVEFSPLIFLLVSALTLVLGFDLIEGISPPADADTLAYHFSIPKQFVASGRIEFVPRAINGATPFLIHMTYAAALGMGGELALTLWAMVTGWVAAILVYGTARRFVGALGALALAILFLTTPAVLYGGGSGQVEVICAAIVIASAVVLIEARESGSWKLLCVAGVLTGFFVGAKYFGLIYAGAAGLVLLFNRHGIKFTGIFSLAAIVVGGQWYGWNWWHTGDPVFPVLFSMLGLPDSAFWTAEFGEYHRNFYAIVENPLAQTVRNWLLYPVIATFDMVKGLESGRTGFGVLLFLLLPLSLAGAVQKKFLNPTIVIFIAVAVIFFTVWFFSAAGQRSRFLLPVYPLLLIAGYTLAFNAALKFNLMRTFAVSVGLVLTIQIAGHGLFASNYARHVFSNETRAEFLARNVGGANAAFWINKNLSNADRVGYVDRELQYLLNVPSFMLHPNQQALVDFRPNSGDEYKFVTQSSKQALSHLLLNTSSLQRAAEEKRPSAQMMLMLIKTGCLTKVVSFERESIRSRTLAQVGGQGKQSRLVLFSFQFNSCPTVHGGRTPNFLGKLQ